MKKTKPILVWNILIFGVSFLLLSCGQDKSKQALKHYTKAVDNFNNWQFPGALAEFRYFVNIASTEKTISDSLVFRATWYMARCASVCEKGAIADGLFDSVLVYANLHGDGNLVCSLLLDYAAHLQDNHKANTAFGHIRKAKGFASQSGSKELSFRADFLLARNYRMQHRFEDEKHILDSLSNIVQSIDEVEPKFLIALESALYYESIYHFPESENAAIEALSLAKEMNNKACLAEACYTLCRAKLINKTIDDLHYQLDSTFSYFNAINYTRKVAETKVLEIRYHFYKSQFNKAFAEVNNLEPQLRNWNDTFNLAEIAYYKSDIFGNWKNYDEEIRLLEQAEMFAEEASNQRVLLKAREKLADRYFDSHNDSISYQYIHASLAKSRVANSLFGEFKDLINMNMFYQKKKKDFAKANIYLDSAYALAQSKLSDQLFSYVFTQKASISYYKQNYQDAITLYKMALSYDSLYDSQWEIAKNLFNVSLNYAQLDRNDESEYYFNKATDIFENSGNKDLASKLFEIMAKFFYVKAKRNWHSETYVEEVLKKSINYAFQAIRLKEEIRLTADDESRKKYLDAEYGIYQLLISCYKQLGDNASEFDAVETSKTKWLEERISHNSQLEHDILLPEMQAKIDDETLFLSYAKRVESYFHASAIDNSEYFSALLYKNKFVIDSLKQVNGFLNYLDTILSAKDLHLFKDQLSSNSNKPQFIKELFFRFINYYRDLIQHSSFDSNQKQDFICASKAMYRFLISPFEQQLKGKKRIIIIPDGLLGFVPFETLINEHGKYLIQEFDIQYIQSVSVWNMLNERNYEERPMELIAFGGADYSSYSFKAPIYAGTSTSGKENNVSFAEKREINDSYGFSQFEEIPGSLSEIEQISDEFSKRKIYSGKKVTEALIKELSAEGKLSKYQIIHFSTHGIFNSEHPNMSAIVVPAGNKDEDGFLMANEIAMLKLNADFVNLSACETGLGEIYEGEGVVGIAQSFVIAGANALSVSLWQVADKSTSLFMTELYKTVKDENISYATAMNRIKRKFINGEYHKALEEPYFWASFVYYGK